MGFPKPRGKPTLKCILVNLISTCQSRQFYQHLKMATHGCPKSVKLILQQGCTH